MTVRIKEEQETRCDCGVNLVFEKVDVFTSIAPTSRFGANFEYPAILCPACKTACNVGVKL